VVNYAEASSNVSGPSKAVLSDGVRVGGCRLLAQFCAQKASGQRMEHGAMKDEPKALRAA
jgi:hypothetical protein